MASLITIVNRAQDGDVNAYGELVCRFQDMAVGYAFGILGDAHLAEDAAQEAFVAAYADLPQLQAPEAFPAWFQRVVFKHCDRLTRGKRIPTVPMDEVEWVVSNSQRADDMILAKEQRVSVREAIQSLPDSERIVIALFYMSESSLAQVGAVLALPVTTVKNRLQSARKRLKERMFEMAEKTLTNAKPSKDNTFSDKVMDKVVKVQQTVPFLWVTDVEKSVDFYVNGLGFQVNNKWEPDGKLRWCWLQHGGAALMLQEDHEGKPVASKRGAGVKLYFICEDAKLVYEQATGRGIEASEIEVGNGMDFTDITDPDGYKLCFESPTIEEDTV